METALPRVAIAVPSGDMVHADFAMAYAELCRGSSALPLHLISVKSSIVAIARNNGVDLARQSGADYLFFLDSDMVFPPTALLRLLLHRQDIVGATYVRRTPPFGILGGSLAVQAPDRPKGLLEMQRLPGGCLLIRTSVFDRLAKPYFHYDVDPANGDIIGEDYVFCDAVRAAGIQIWCDLALSEEVGHLGQRIHRLADAPPHAGGE